jgi:DNA-binding transcriptional regulator LsrR (DeoR family)
MARVDELRLIVKVARLYHEKGLGQADISAQLDLSQPTVSRLLKRAKDEQIVRTTLNVPTGFHPELEEAIEKVYRLKEAIVVDSEDDSQVLRDIGAAAAYYLDTTLKQDEFVGISSWSSTLLAMVEAMYPRARPSGARVIQILGGLGNPGAEKHAAHLTRRLAQLLGGTPYFLPAPGVVGSVGSKDALLNDPFVKEAMERFNQITLALVGIGDIQPSRLLADSGNVFSPDELHSLQVQGAVGDICLRFFDGEGSLTDTQLNQRVIGMDLDQLKRAERSVGVAGGKRKRTAILGALKGGWVNVLITDRSTAEWLVAQCNSEVAEARA